MRQDPMSLLRVCSGGHQLVVHTIVTGGQALLDTLHGAAQLVKQLDAARFVIWLNPFWGPVADNGCTFEQTLRGATLAVYRSYPRPNQGLLYKQCLPFLATSRVRLGFRGPR